MENKIFPHTFWRPFLDCMPQLYFRPKYVWFPVHLKGPVIPDPSGQLAELIVYITSTRVDLYSHQILLNSLDASVDDFAFDMSAQLLQMCSHIHGWRAGGSAILVLKWTWKIGCWTHLLQSGLCSCFVSAPRPRMGECIWRFVLKSILSAPCIYL